MKNHRILLLSRVRPSRAVRIAKHISRDFPGAEICGIVQHSLNELSLEQQRIAARRLDNQPVAHGLKSRFRACLSSVISALLHLVLWCIHGCPRSVPGFLGPSIKKLVETCRGNGWPVLAGDAINEASLALFIREQRAEVAIALNETQLTPSLLELPSLGWINVYDRAIESDGAINDHAREVTIEYLTKDTASPFSIASVVLPKQPHDTPAALTLKLDLIADDLLRQTVSGLLNSDAFQTRESVTRWTQTILSPYLHQLKSLTPSSQQVSSSSRHRPAWKLAVEALLFMPFLSARNWYRRWSGRCPVTILTHHLVSDRTHRMGISTEAFWRAARFLQKHYRIVSLREATHLLRSRHLKIPTVVLTFDDGYADNFVSLRAVAEELDLPVVLFIATDAVEMQREFEHDLSMGIEGAMPLTWDQIRYWSAQGAEFGSHTRSHFDCGSHDRVRLKEEIIGSKEDLEVHLGVPIDSFAFPFGWHHNISPESLEIAAASHYYFLSSVGGENLPASVAGGHLLRKGFYPDLWELELDMQGVFELLENAKRKLREMLPCPTVRDEGLTAAADTRHATASLSVGEESARITGPIPVSSLDV